MDIPLDDPDEGLGVTDEDLHDQEELEIALYSQIHFEDNTDSGFLDFSTEPDDVQYDFKVEGNSRTGFLSYKMTSDCILNKQLEEKASNEGAHHLFKASQGKADLFKGTSLSHRNEEQNLKAQPSKDKQSNAKTTLLTKQKKQKDDTPLSVKANKQKLSVAEELILGCDSDSDSDLDSDVEVISSDGDPRNRKSTPRGRKTDRFIEAMNDDTDESNGEDGRLDNPDIQFNIIGGKLPSSSSDQSEESANEDDWKILVTDTQYVKQNRYFKPVLCFNCKERGHLSKSCPKPKKQVVCSLCSELGHTHHSCLNPVCSNCLEQGHTFRRCRMPKYKLDKICHRCKMEGHEVQKCPDIWRQFHLTIEPNKFVKGKPRKDAQVYCYNCGGDDHFGHECEEARSNRFVRFTNPFVCKYQPQRFHQELAATESREDEYENFKSPNKKRKAISTSDRKTKPKQDRKKDSSMVMSLRNHHSSLKTDYKRKPGKTDVTATQLNDDVIEIFDSPVISKKRKPEHTDDVIEIFDSPVEKRKANTTQNRKTEHKQGRKKGSPANYRNEQTSSNSNEKHTADKNKFDKVKKGLKHKKNVSSYVPFIKKKSDNTDRSNPDYFDNDSGLDHNKDALFLGLDSQNSCRSTVSSFKKSERTLKKKNKFKNKKSRNQESMHTAQDQVMSARNIDVEDNVRNPRGFKTTIGFKSQSYSAQNKTLPVENLKITIGNTKSQNSRTFNTNTPRNKYLGYSKTDDDMQNNTKLKKKKNLKRKK